MKEEILKRAMFAMPLSKDARNSGIMSGFDMDEMDEAPEPSEEMPQMARSPQNPEILMNNLRGDVRSVDARYQELAQMVGEEAAHETPPEVLAMLQPQLAQQAGGIGGLPQAQGMQPGGAPGGAPAAGGQPGQQPPAPQQPQGIAAAMPQGMEGAPPFSQGAQAPQQFSHGGSVEPMTPDGLPPMHAQFGAFVNPAMRFAQMGADKLSTLGMEANALGGRLMSQGFPQTFRPIFENVRGPAGRFTAEQTLKYPTLTEHLSNLVGPTATGIAQRMGNEVEPAVKAGAALVGASGLYKSIFGGNEPQVSPERRELLKNYNELYDKVPPKDKEVPWGVNPELKSNQELQDKINYMQNLLSGTLPTSPTTEPPKPTVTAPAPAAPPAQTEGAAPAAAPEKTTTDFIKANVAPSTLEPTKSRIERIKEARAEYAPLYRELLGDTKDDMYTNAMLLLADAGFKYAQLPASRGTTPISLVATAASGIPQGFMSLLAQARDNKIKVDTAALSQAVNDVQEQDKYAQQLKLKMLDIDKATMVEMIRQNGGTLEDGGAGMIIAKTKGGGYKGVSIDPNNPTVQSAVSSPWTLRPTDNPFVENRGQAPSTVETNKEERTKLTSTLRVIDNTLKAMDNAEGLYVQAYGPGAWFQSKVNNLLVPIIPSAVTKSGLDQVAAANQLRSVVNNAMKTLAAANNEGRVAVQEQEWAQPMLSALENPENFFKNKEVAAKAFSSMKTQLLNNRQQVLTQLGFENNDYVMKVPNTGTQNDPFVISTDPDQQKRMFNFLSSTIGKVQDPRAVVYVQMPNGTLQTATPSYLRGLTQ